jgi:neutral ceramidase
MKKLISLSLIPLFLMLIPGDADASNVVEEAYTGWKAGVASVIITPNESMWMAGYGSRDHPSTGTVNDLWVKALALQDINGNESVLVTMDLEEIPKVFSDWIKNQLKTKFQLSKAQIIINVSHTHSSPVLQDFGDIYPLDSIQIVKIKKYTDELGDKIVALVGKALHSLKPVQLYSGNGVARFQVNRRNNSESTLDLLTELKGPNDYSVPVIKIVNKSGKVVAIAFGYACHNTVLSDYKWSGDYAGFAQSELEKMYPGALALFFQGCGGDQNPLPRGTVALAQQYGQTLASAVESVIKEDMRELSPHLSTSYKEIELSLTAPPTKDELSMMIKKYSGYQRRWASRLLNELDGGEALPTSYPYPIQIWRLGDQTMMALGGEAVIEYAIQLKRIFGEDMFVLGYSNDVMAYIPSASILTEGGYEGASSVMTTYLPSTWASNIETVILSQMLQLAEEAEVPIPESKLIKNK